MFHSLALPLEVSLRSPALTATADVLLLLPIPAEGLVGFEAGVGLRLLLDFSPLFGVCPTDPLVDVF